MIFEYGRECPKRIGSKAVKIHIGLALDGNMTYPFLNWLYPSRIMLSVISMNHTRYFVRLKRTY